jgi:two-component system chemotaxis sensor kinase CheA
MDFDRDQVIAAFIVEAEEGLQRMEEILIAAEIAPIDPELLDDIFRVAHTIKGNASLLGFTDLAEFAHVVEDLLEALRNRQIAVSQTLISLLLNAIDALRVLVPSASEGNDKLSESHQELKTKIAEYVSGGHLDREKPVFDEVSSPLAVPGTVTQGARNRTLRVDIAKLDRMLNLTGEIAITQGRLRHRIDELRTETGREMLEVHSEIERLYKDLQEEIMGARMVPIGPMFQQFVRAVRDISKSHDKLARLEVVGGDVEVDTRILEHLRDPLLHMIRNAVGHGIELPQDRRAKGKNPCGILKLKAFHSAGNILIQLSDDGAGFDRRRIMAKAKAAGLVEEGANLSDQEILRLVFNTGFSTAENVTDLSGRGMGMDIARRNIDLLRGNIEIQSAEGEGTTITIRLPLTLAIIEGFSVMAGGETYVIPLEMISECLELPKEQTSSDSGGVISVRGKPLPYVRLRDVLGGSSNAVQRENVVVVYHDGGHVGIAVDELLGESQAIIKPLDRLFRRAPGVCGSTIAGDGRIALILDVNALMRYAIGQHAHS